MFWGFVYMFCVPDFGARWYYLEWKQLEIVCGIVCRLRVLLLSCLKQQPTAPNINMPGAAGHCPQTL
jgi:hypothetical protein